MNNEIQTFDWNKLKKIKIKQYHGDDDDFKDLTMLSYQIDTDFTKKVHRQCR